MLEVTAPSDFVPFAADAVEQSVASLFEERVRLYGDRLAVQDGDRVLTYEELNRAANRVAHAILAIKPFRARASSDLRDLSYWEAQAEPVAVFMEQGAEAVIAVFGLLKAGKLVVIIDPADPHTRKRFILNHAPALIILTNERFREAAHHVAPPGCGVLSVNEIGHRIPDENPDLPISALDPALLVYTSGSTGRPKGLVHSQRNLLHDIMLKTNLMKISPSDHVSLLAWGTGQAVKLIFAALLNGASLHPFDLKGEGVAQLGAWMRRQEISVHTASAPVLRSFFEVVGASETFPTMRLVRPASDTVYPRDIESMKKMFPHNCVYINALSSNETGVICANVMHQKTRLDSARVSVGMPLSDITVNLLDKDGVRVGTGDAGIIAITSRYIARGYWRRPDLTKSAFSSDPDDPELVTFRSADRARQSSDGKLELLGRNDFQIKIRGYRVDAAEVESALLGHENIIDAVVVHFENDRMERRLVGYVAPRRYPAPTSSALRRFLQDKLNDYMIPATFVVLNTIPLLPTGKTNRRALPEPGTTRPLLDNPYVAPSTGVEERLVDIWSDILGIDDIGVDDPFMELGGDSLNAGRVAVRILESFGVEIPLRLMFDRSTIAQIANEIEKQQADPVKRYSHHTIERQPGNGPWAISFGQLRLWFLDQLDPGNATYNMPKPIRLKGDVHIGALSEALECIVERHEVLRTNFLPRPGDPDTVAAFVADMTPVPLPVFDLRDRSESDRDSELDRLIELESERPFRLDSDLKLRNTLYRLQDDEYVLLCVTHHIASDRWSRGVLLRELAATYGALVAGESPPVTELPIRYSDFARWQNAFENSDLFRSQLGYWDRRLRGAPTSLDLPTDRPRLINQRPNGFSYMQTFPAELSKALIELARREDVTLFMLFLSAVTTLFYRLTGQSDILVGAPVSGRTTRETENLIGFFINSLVMRNDVSGNPSFREVLGRVREQALGAYANADVPFEQLVNHLRPARDGMRNPFFQTLLDVDPVPVAIRYGDGIPFELLNAQRRAAPFDQSWNVAMIGTRLRVRVEYNSDLFDPGTIEQTVEQLKTMLEGVLIHPEAPIDTLRL